MSRATALSVLRGTDQPRFVCGMTWLPSAVLDDLQVQLEAVSHGQALAAFATSVQADLAFVDLGQPESYDAVGELHVADIAAVWTIGGVFGRVAEKLGWSELIRMTASEPGLLARRFDEALHEALVGVRDAVQSGADAIVVADDLAGASGPLIAPDYVIDALVPCYHRIALEILAEGGVPMFHSDGDVRMFFTPLARAGFSAVHLAGLDQHAFGVSARSARGAGLVVLGGIPARSLEDDPGTLGAMAGETAEALGGVVVCDDGGITTLSELSGLATALDAARESYAHPRP